MFSVPLVANIFGPQGLILLAIIVVLFGAKRLPELGKSLGETIREFSKMKHKDEEDPADPKLPPKA